MRLPVNRLTTHDLRLTVVEPLRLTVVVILYALCPMLHASSLYPLPTYDFRPPALVIRYALAIAYSPPNEICRNEFRNAQ